MSEWDRRVFRVLRDSRRHGLAVYQRAETPKRMKQIITGLLAIATLGAGYHAYTTKQQAPPKTTLTEPANNSDYAGLVLPHLQTAFSALDPNQGRLAEEQLVNLRQLFARENGNTGVSEAARLVEQLFPVLAEREQYRAKLNTGASDTSNDYFNSQTERAWLVRANVLAPPLQREYADLVAVQERSGKEFVRIVGVYEPYFVGSKFGVNGRSPLEQRNYRVSYVHGAPIYVAGYGIPTTAATQVQVVPLNGYPARVGEIRRYEPTRFEEHRTGLEEQRIGFEGRRGAFDEHRVGLEERRPFVEEHRQPVEGNRPPTLEHRPVATGLNQPPAMAHSQPVGQPQHATNQLPPAAHPAQPGHTQPPPPVQATRPAGSGS
jgi:hypothetical protein